MSIDSRLTGRQQTVCSRSDCCTPQDSLVRGEHLSRLPHEARHRTKEFIMRSHMRTSLAAVAVAIAAMAAGCSSETPDEDMGTIGMELQIAPGVSINTVSWTITNSGTAFTRTGSV